MSLSRAAIVDQLKEIVGADRVITDETVLKKNSIDRFRKFPDLQTFFGTFNNPYFHFHGITRTEGRYVLLHLLLFKLLNNVAHNLISYPG